MDTDFITLTLIILFECCHLLAVQTIMEGLFYDTEKGQKLLQPEH